VNDLFVRRLSTIVVVVCLLVLAVTAALVVSPALRRQLGIGPTAEPPAYTAGDRVDVTPAAYTSAPISVLVFARSTCPACERSADFHKQLVAASKASGIPAVLITPSADGETERRYAEGLGIGASQVYQSPPGSIKLRSVPAVMVVDGSGLIRHVWFGKPDAVTEAAILAIVPTLAGGPS
jgi:hypothetical protein